MAKFYIIGVGPGTEEYLLPIAKKYIEKADCLIGGRRVLSLFCALKREKVCLGSDYERVISYLRQNKDKKNIAVIVSGDPGFYSLLGKISQIFDRREYIVIPGVSIAQVAFARLGRLWQDVKVVSLHGRREDNLAEQIGQGQEVFLLTDNSFPPQQISSSLLEQGAENRPAIVLEGLGYPGERIVRADLKAISKMDNFGLCVMIIE